MASITIRSLDDDVKTRLRVRAARHHRSMEKEVRLIVCDAIRRKRMVRNLTDIIRSHFSLEDGADLEFSRARTWTLAAVLRLSLRLWPYCWTPMWCPN